MMILKRKKCPLNSSDIPLSAIDHVTLNRGQFKKKDFFHNEGERQQRFTSAIYFD
jgi:hypothetical protein